MVYHGGMSTTTATADARDLDAVFAALSNQTRRDLIERLAGTDATISELAEPLDMTLPAVSKHLRVLERAGLVTRRRDGKSRRCALRPQGLHQVESWIQERREFWAPTLDSLAAHVEQESQR